MTTRKTTLLAVLCLPLLFACSSRPAAPVDGDICEGRCGMVQGVMCGDCGYGFTCNEAHYCVEMTTDNAVAYADEDEETDDATISDDNGTPDTDDLLCPDLRVRANLLAAGFPLKDGNGKMTFCRPGCDTPTENDPQCARNLWDWANWNRYQEYLKGTPGYIECYPWPCEMPVLRASPGSYDPCERSINNYYFDGDGGYRYDLAISGGVVGLSMSTYYYNTEKDLPFGRVMEYSPSLDRYTSIAYGWGYTGYRKGRYFFYTGNSGTLAEGAFQTYIATALKTANGYKFEVIYDDDQHQARFYEPPLFSEKWILLSVEHMAIEVIETVYAKVGEWQWHSFRPGSVANGNLIGDHLAFVYQSGIYYCDLRDIPFDPKKECTLVSREGEVVNDPRLNEDDEYDLVYNEQTRHRFVRVDLSGPVRLYREFAVTATEPNHIGALNDQFRGDMVLYSEKYYNDWYDSPDYKACFQRLDPLDPAHYCSVTPEPTYYMYDEVFGSFEGKYQLSEIGGPSGIVRLRDLDCYCALEGVCPFGGPDDGSPDDDETPDADLAPGTCGNGVVEAGERCDTGGRNGEPGHFCTKGCVNLGEQRFPRIADTGRESDFKTWPTKPLQRIVHDSATGLLWQFDRPEGEFLWDDAYAYCDALDYADHDDWRLPTPHESLSLIDYAAEQGALYAPIGTTDGAAYWTTLRAVGHPQYAWIAYDQGGVRIAPGHLRYRVRCVREFSSFPAVEERYREEVRPDGAVTVLDGLTGVEWTQSTPEERYYFPGVEKYCEDLDYGGYGNWTLPQVNDVRALVDYSRRAPASTFPGLPADVYLFSRQVYPYNDWFAYGVYFREGILSLLYFGNPDSWEMCVRMYR